MYTAWTSFGDSFKDFYFPHQQSWNRRIVFTQGETGLPYDVFVDLRALDGRLFIRPCAPLVWENGSGRERAVSGDSAFSLREVQTGWKLSILLRLCQPEWLRFTKYALPGKPILIGRGENADICDSGILMSAKHALLARTQEGYYQFQDTSSNGTYLNGRRLPSGVVRLAFGDTLAFPTGLKIVFLTDCIAINRTAGTREVRLPKWLPREASSPTSSEESDLPSMYWEYQRPPRMLLKCTAEDVEIEPPIPKSQSDKTPLFMQLGPSMTMILPMLMGSFVAGRGGGLSSGIVMIATSSLLAVTWGIVNRNYRKGQEQLNEQNRLNMYRSYIGEMESQLHSMNETELKRLSANFPNVMQCAQMPIQKGNELWNRMPSHADFLEIRLGVGTVPTPYTIATPQQKLSLINDTLRSEPERLRTAYASIHNAPVTLPLQNESVIGLLGDARAVAFAQGMLLQIASLHSYHDVRIAVLTDENSASQWSWARWLPHVFTSEDRELRMVASTPSEIHEVATHIDEVLSIRKSNAEDNSQVDEQRQSSALLPHYLIFCMDKGILESELALRALLTNHYGMTLVMVGTDMTHLPKECRVVLSMEKSAGRIYESSGDVQEVDFEYPDPQLVRAFSRAMAPMRLRDVTENAAIPSLVSFLDIYGVRRVDDLEIWRMWTENHTWEGLKSIIGYRAGSQPFVLDISDKYHGPHGLIAGTTGSGKSVMLETYILSLAVNYSPRQVQFVLIDYKGGGMADSFRELPHVSGIIDNLQGERVIQRALASLNGEIHRREVAFREVGLKDINEYNRQYGDTPGREMPHLIIIVDEFAELKSEQPEFMGELVSASRVGRSLGIHLILATQKPSNSVSDEIWANSRFHLCLRVQTRQDSMEMLKRPDAAYIKGMGRCFIQIGNDELFDEVQTSYSGLTYSPNNLRAEEVPQLLSPIGHVHRVPKPRTEDKGGKPPTQMQAVLTRVFSVAREHSMEKRRMLWLPEMPSQVHLTDIPLFARSSHNGTAYPNFEGNLLFLVGLADDVAHQRYLPYVVDLTVSRNLLLCGLAGTGKTTLVQSMVYSLCSVYDPEHLQIYILSLTSQVLGNLKGFPHVGDIVFDKEETEARRLLDMLYAELNRRAELFAAASTDSFVEYNRAAIRHARKTEPAIVVFADRFLQLRELFASDESANAMLQTLLQEGSGRGIHFIVTAMAQKEVPSSLQPFFAGIALQQKERSDYSDCIGKRVPYDMPPIASFPGRGMCVMEGNVYEVQFALGGEAPKATGESFASLSQPLLHTLDEWSVPAVVETDLDRAEKLVTYGQSLRSQWTGRIPRPIARIPKEPTFALFAAEEAFTRLMSDPFLTPIGYSVANGEVFALDLSDKSSWLVYGPRRSGITNFLQCMALTMRARGADVHILADSAWSPFAKETGLPLYTTAASVAEFLTNFISSYARPRKELHDRAVAQGRSAARKQAEAFHHCCILVDNAQWLNEEFNKEEYREHLPMVQGLLGDIIEKQYYNFSLFMGLSAREKAAILSEPLKRLVGQGRGIALGGRLNEFDPVNVSEGMAIRSRSASLPAGHGYVGNNGTTVQIIVPQVAQEADE